MKKAIFPLLALFLIVTVINAQPLISVENSGNSSFYTDLGSAVFNAQSGDTIYIPGGSFNIGNLTIDKEISIFGVGHYPDSTIATFYTNLIGNIFLVTGADSTFLTGFYLSGNIKLGITVSDQIVNNISITRCNINNLYLSFDGSTSTTSENFFIDENVIRGDVNGGYAQHVIFENNIFNNQLWYFNGNTIFSNNIFLYYRLLYSGSVIYCLFRSISYCLFQNNIFLATNSSTNVGYPSNCIFNNNVFEENISFPWNVTNVGTNNIVNQTQSSIFVNQSSYLFNYGHDYHLKSTFLVGVNAGTDGTNIGIYGTSFPYKEGAVPANPHIQYKTISSGTDNNGNLNINIKVAGQDR